MLNIHTEFHLPSKCGFEVIVLDSLYFGNREQFQSYAEIFLYTCSMLCLNFMILGPIEFLS